jgi:hypothetical protein
MGDYKERNGTTRVGDLLRSIGKSNILEKAVNVAGEIGTGDWFGAVKALVATDPTITKETKEDILKQAELDLADLKDARELQRTALKQDDIFSKRFLYYLSIGTFAFACVIVLLLFFIDIPTENRDVINFILGIVVGNGLGSIFNFFFGSSQGSKDKTPLIGKR